MRRYSLFLSSASVLLAIFIHDSTLATISKDSHPAMGFLRANVESDITSTAFNKEERVLTTPIGEIANDAVQKYVRREDVVDLINSIKDTCDVDSIKELKAHISSYNQGQESKVQLSKVLASEISPRALGRAIRIAQHDIDHPWDRKSYHDQELNNGDYEVQSEIFKGWLDKGISIDKLYDEFQLDAHDDVLHNKLLMVFADKGISIDKFYDEFQLDNVLHNPLLMVFAEYVVEYASKLQTHDTFLSVMTEKLGGEEKLIEELMKSSPYVESVDKLKKDLIENWRNSAMTTEDVMKKLGLFDLKAYLTKTSNRKMLRKYLKREEKEPIQELRRIFGDGNIVYETRDRNDRQACYLRSQLFSAWKETHAKQKTVFDSLKIRQDVNIDMIDEKIRVFVEYFNLKKIKFKTMSKLFGGNQQLEKFLTQVKFPEDEAAMDQTSPSLILRNLFRKNQLKYSTRLKKYLKDRLHMTSELTL